MMKHFVARTCTVVRSRAEERGRETESRLPHEAKSSPLESFRDEPAYVLLGPPGSGKTEAFKREAMAEEVQPITARDFQTLGAGQQGRNTTLHIDGLDETRAGATDGRTPFDAIRAKLHDLGRPRFRLSCREADWFGANDRERLKEVAPNGELLVLRLDPLSDQGILEILDRNLDREDPKGFVDAARRLGVGGLLRNPLNLEMLSAAVAEANGEWPRTRTETFDMACRKLVSEENPEHQIAQTGTADATALLDAAGELCALLLMAGKAGVTLPGTEPDTDHPRLEAVPQGEPQLLHRVAGTNLFASSAEGRLVPAHRQLAEFLAARHLADLIAEGLPVGRVLSLMTGFDGGVISEFRGLAAWLAALGKMARSEIIERDAPGVVLYGDVRDFSPDEKGAVFHHVGRVLEQNPWLLRDPSLNPQMGELFGPELEARFRAALTTPRKSEAATAIARLVLRTFDDIGVPRGFNEELLSIVRDSTWPAPVRYRALDLCIRTRAQDETVGARLLEALHDLYYNEQDSVISGEHCGRLLAAFYPSEMSIVQAAKYLRYPRSSGRYDPYAHFWRNTVVQRSSSAQLLELLHILRERVEATPNPFHPGPDGLDLPDDLPGRCLKALVGRSASEVKPSLLYFWIGTGLSNRLMGLDTDSLASWLSERPRIRQALVLRASSDDDRHRARNVAILALQAGHERDELPSDLRSIRFVAESSLRDRTVQPLVAAGHDRDGDDREDLDSQFESGLSELREHMRSNLEDIRANRGPPTLLHNLAQAYLGRFAELGAPTARERVSRMLGHKEDLLDSALAALKDAIARSDLPTPSELVQLWTKRRLHLLAYPVMAGLREWARADPARPAPLDDQQARLALTMWYTTGEPPRFFRRSDPGERVPRDDLAGEPAWFADLTESRPELAADVLVSVSRTTLRSGREPRHGYYAFIHPSGSCQLPKLATLRLLEVFPVKCHTRLLPHLRDLLIAACCHSDGPALVDLIGNKLRFKSMNMGQRVYWLAAGHLVAPDQYSEPLESFVSGKGRRVRHLTTMLVGRGGLPRQLEDAWDVAVLAPLIRLLGPSYKPTPELHTGVAYTVTLQMEAATYVSRHIDRLATLPTVASTGAFAGLYASQSLQHWSDKLSAAAHRNSVLRRETEFLHPGLDQVAEVLDNGRPASAADLCALTVDLLRQSSKRIRDGATSDWRQYWNVDGYNRAEKPKPENAGRDALLSDLEQALTPLGVEAVKEGSYADDKRADIRVSVPGYNIPIEIKRSCHDDWWSSIKTQLIAKYTRDPGTDGYGIYLVFWYGEAEGCRPVPASGRRPKSPEEVRRALLDSLSDQERRKISVCVIDVSKPDA